jgi:hypothetical protein
MREMSRRQLIRVVLTATLCLTAQAAAAQTPSVDTTRAAAWRDTTAASMSTVTFMSGTEIYVGAGRLDGLDVGATVFVLQRDSVVSTLRVKFLASHQSSCEVVAGSSDVAVGDRVRFYPPATTGAKPQVAVTTIKRPRRLSGPGIHGRFGSRYLRSDASLLDSVGTETNKSGFSQPSFDARLDGQQIGGTPLGLAVDLRTRRTTSTSFGSSDSTKRTTVDGHTRVYQAALLWNTPGAGFRAVAGRQYLSAVTSVSLFDGGLLELNGGHLTVGAFGGYTPDAANLGWSTHRPQYGAYFQIHSRTGAATPVSLSFGGVRQFTDSLASRFHPERQFGFTQLSISNQFFSLYGLQEVDYLTDGQQTTLGTSSRVSWTNQLAAASVRPARWLSINGSFDNRKAIPLYRDVVNAQTAFDDAYRKGYGVGVQLSSGRIWAGGDWRRSTGGNAHANSYTGTLGINGLTSMQLGLSARATWYQNQNDKTSTSTGSRSSGRLYSAQMGLDPLRFLHVSFNAGLRRDVQKSSWYGADVDMSIARAWYLSLSGLRQKDPFAGGGGQTTTQLFGGITWRF